MYLEKLKLFGFKSFAKKTEIKFLPGITSIVGPNGCGKSNIVDALRWVLGEQKAGTLRSDRMESVIFNGSKSMKPLGMAEVSLVIQNNNGVLPVEYSEVVITRRLFRSGESQYLLNSSPCRLKDINDLLMDTGLAPDAYSVIELSMVEQILSGKAEDRRRIFEEAVGLTKYKQRRKQTFRKLDATEQDLLRIADIIGEVRSKVNSLHRQVRRAQRYQSLSKGLRDSEIRVATHKFSQIYEELSPLNKKFEESNRERESLSSQISFKEAEIETIQTELIDNDDQLKQAQGKLSQVNHTIQKQEEEILLNRERLKSLAENKTRIHKEIENLKQRISIRKEQLVETQERKSSTTTEITKLQEQYVNEKQLLDELEQQLTEKRNVTRDSEQKVIALMQSISEKQRNMERFKAQLEHQKKRAKVLNENIAELREKIAKDESTAKIRREVLREKHLELEGLTETLAELELNSENLQNTIDELKSKILTTNNQIESSQQRIAFIKDLLESYADYPEGVKYLMVNDGAEKGYQGAFADILVVKEEYRKAIETALGDAAGYLLVPDTETAYLGIEALKNNQKGVVTFLPVNRLKEIKQRPQIPSQNGVIGWADQIVECEKKYEPAVNVLMGSYLIVENAATARQLIEKFSGEQIQIVTKEGELFFNWGGIRGGKKETESESLIGRQAQLNSLINREEKLHAELTDAEKKLKEKENEKAENTRIISATAQTLKNSQQELSNLQVEISQVDYRVQQAKTNLHNAEQEQKAIGDEQRSIEEQVQQIEPELAHISQKHSVMNNEIKTRQHEIEELEQKRNIQSDKASQIKLKVVEITGNERSLLQAFEQTEKIIEEHETMITKLDKELIENSSQKEQLESRIDELGELLSGDYATKESHEKRVDEFERKSQSIRETIDEKAKVIKTLRGERETFSETLHEAELRISELRIKADNMYRRIMEEYDWDLKREPIDENYDVAVDEEEIEKVRERIKRLGPVNLLALKEYDKEKERLDFLEKQQEDLISAEQNLKETIEHINQTAQEKFDSVFQDIRTNFIKVFKQFFPNGESNLVIEDKDDPLEANIEIVANPKGKRLESLTLLSGGEKALTAISLLFGIYLVKPSPVCILDEVDAPLDDNNISRFIDTLQDFSNSTQFVMVTHNKLTMKAAHSMYGITMEESGVSKVVSVKLE